ncbi:unnamed protein product [Cercopithifilaria johnstoni]|uniref:Protein kinase domain-containing protein n=1 Tax=Cercopithifilaria johnstoni TaxID=2874296 RepID=A0A8J2LN92_9BILA|nr:unnamed protein product [Cercopithifilaria johnstoni]
MLLGGYGVVYKAFHKQTKEPAAIKMIRLEKREEGIPATTMREIALLRELRHPNIIILHGIVLEDYRIYMVFEYFEMDLRRYIDSIPKDKLMDKIQSKIFLYQVLQGICHCHQRRVMHRDLKPQNLLINSKGLLKLGDFGLARVFGVPMRAYTHEVVTLWYRAPEIILGTDHYTLGVDMWSIGCIFAEMASKQPLFMGDSEISQLYSIFRALSTPTEENWPGVTKLPHYQELFPQWKKCELEKLLDKYMDSNDLTILKAMLSYDPAQRISAKQLLQHPYFNDIDRSKLVACDYAPVLNLSSLYRPI